MVAPVRNFAFMSLYPLSGGWAQLSFALHLLVERFPQGSGVFRTYPVLCSMRWWGGIAEVVDTGMPRDHVGL